MIESVTKRDGRVEPFTPNKLNGWGEWAAKALGPDMDWSSVVLETVTDMPEQVSTTLLQQQLIKNCLQSDSWLYNRMAGRLYAALMHKEVHGVFMPTVLQLHRRLQKLGYMEVLDYSDAEYAEVEKLIDHERDFSYAHYQLHTHLSKYAIADRVKNRIYETSQFIYMRMAMALAVDQPRERRMTDVARFYEHLSMNRINAPTPNHINLGTPLRGYASCCLYTTADTARSIAVGNHIAYTMTYMSAGIGSHMNLRSVNDPVRGGAIRHQGKLPYLRAVVSEVKSSLQNGRGGACTSYFSIFDPEVETLLRLKNPMSTEDRKIRGMDYSWGSNRLFARKAARNEEIFLFNGFTAPDLYEALYSDDEERFEQLYQKYEKNPLFPKRFINARELLITACNEWNETGRIYEHNIHEMNRHTPFKETIYSSNLCSEIDLPTGAYNHITEIYRNEDVSFVEFEDEEGGRHRLPGERAVQTGRGMVYPLDLRPGDDVGGIVIQKITQRSSPEVATCNLAGICVDNVESDAQYEEVAYYALLMIDKCIHLAEYELPHIGYTSKARLNAGVGILGLAHLMAREHQRYTTKDGKQFIHQAAERHFYHLVKASLRLGRELGNAPWMHKTRWPEGWMPLDSYNRNVDQIADFTNRYDWEALRREVVANGGIRNSALAAHMPTETSANASGTTNGVYPIRELTMIKTDNQRVNYWAAPEGEELAVWYESAWDIPARDMIEAYAIIQKWTDQGISADFYRKVIGDAFIGSSEMIRDYLYRIRMGLKSKYYMNQKTSAGFKQLAEAEAERKELVGRMVGSAMVAAAADKQGAAGEGDADGPTASVLDADPECNGSCTL